MMRLAEQWSAGRWIAMSALIGVTAGAVAAATQLTCADPPAISARPPALVGDDGIPIHIKYRVGAQVSASMAAYQMRHLFEPRMQQAAYDDPRLRWMRIAVPMGEVFDVLATLAADPNVETAFVPPVPELPTTEIPFGDASCPISTPSFESYQGYLGPAPHGIDAPAAWRRGVRGQDVWFGDVEGGWNPQHEDLPGDRIVHVSGEVSESPMYRMHGTAVLGEVVGLDNRKGMVGIAPDVERVITSSHRGSSAAEAIDAAAEAMRPGDVLLLEMHSPGPRGKYLPMEFWDDCFDAIEAATARGIIVIEAAGNGAEDLDHKAYKGKLSRKGRDSGAIMVGAGGPARDGFVDRERLDFSNYGSRVDAQGWGRRVATLDYGDLQSCDNRNSRHYTDEFSGTSSASPIVAGAAVLLQSYAKSRGRTLSPVYVRELLANTGTAQVGEKRESIGPRPDLARAMKRLEQDLARKKIVCSAGE